MSNGFPIYWSSRDRIVEATENLIFQKFINLKKPHAVVVMNIGRVKLDFT